MEVLAARLKQKGAQVIWMQLADAVVPVQP